MASRRSQAVQCIAALGVALILCVGCSSDGTADSPSDSADATVAPADAAESDAADSGAADSGAEGSSADTGAETSADDGSGQSSSAGDALSEAVEVVDLAAGEQVQDAQGNLVAVYGVSTWPDSFDRVSDAARAEFRFVGDIDRVAAPATRLIALDIGMCAAGLGSDGTGTAEFFAHADGAEGLSDDPVLDRAVLARHPVVHPAFDLPAQGECARGWLPVVWAEDTDPSVARYVLTTRADGTSEPERHVYQWDVADAPAAPPDPADPAAQDADTGDDTAFFAPGRTVRFNEGRLLDTTVTIDGWAELIDVPAAVDGTRPVAVSLTVCPTAAGDGAADSDSGSGAGAGQAIPEFGLGADGWNLVAPTEAVAPLVEDDGGCLSGWIDFAVPLGAVPTSFFAGDGSGSPNGYAEWSLLDAAIEPPR